MRLALLALLLTSAASSQAPCADPEAETPQVVRFLASDAEAMESLVAYLCRLRDLNATHDLLDAVILRDTVAVRLDRWLDAFAMDPAMEWGSEEQQALFAELERLALQPLTAEGFVTGTVPGAFPPDVMDAHAPEDLALYLAFREAEGASFSGEYPYLDLSPQIEMIRLGERLRALAPASPYVAATQEAFLQALATLTSLHAVAEGGSEATWLTGVGTSEFWPFAADGGALARIVEEQPASRYAPVFARILASPPALDPTLETAFVVVAETPDVTSAQARYAAFVDAGVDVVGWLPPVERDGPYAIVYRYYPTGFDPRVDRAIDALDAMGIEPMVRSRPAALPEAD